MLTTLRTFSGWRIAHCIATPLHVLRSTPPPAYWTLKFQEAVVLATLPDRKAEAAQAFRDGITLSRREGDFAMTFICTLQQVLGPANIAPTQREARDLHEHFSHRVPNGVRNHWYSRTARLFTPPCSTKGSYCGRPGTTNSISARQRRFYISARAGPGRQAPGGQGLLSTLAGYRRRHVHRVHLEPGVLSPHRRPRLAVVDPDEGMTMRARREADDAGPDLNATGRLEAQRRTAS